MTVNTTRISFLNGEFLPHQNAKVHIEDRGMQFADGVYEVTLMYNNKLIDNDRHIERLFNSLAGLGIKHNYTKEQLTKLSLMLFAQNNLTSGTIYLQITRGVAPRNQNIPIGIIPTIIATVSPLNNNSIVSYKHGISVMTETDIRWQYCNIKSINLIAGSLMKQKADNLGYDDAILLKNDLITECCFSNLFIVDHNGQLVTRNLDNSVLPGITRQRIIELAIDAGIKVVERAFNYNELVQAQEIFSTSTTLLVRPITSIDNIPVGNGKIGETTKKLSSLYHKFLENST